jgi:hypothetical protein
MRGAVAKGGLGFKMMIGLSFPDGQAGKPLFDQIAQVQHIGASPCLQVMGTEIALVRELLSSKVGRTSDQLPICLNSATGAGSRRNIV